MVPRVPYTGSSRELVVSFDIGTTFSGSSYCRMDPGQIPTIQNVNRYPGQEHKTGIAKIPSVLFYDKKGELKATGAETEMEAMIEQQISQGWMRVEWWKILLAPKDLLGTSKRAVKASTLSSLLPPGKTAIDIYTDFLAYLFRCMKQFFIEHEAMGDMKWNSVESCMKFILTHPNGWEGVQQSTMRQAACRAGLVPDTDEGYTRISFLTEGEASLHYCATSTAASEAFKERQNVLIIDAGGGTIDVSGYRITTSSPLSVEEVFSPECSLQGSQYVTRRAAGFIKNRFQNSKVFSQEDIELMTREFDSDVKPRFKEVDEPYFIKFGSIRDNEPAKGVTRGKLKLLGTEVEGFFTKSVDTIIEVFNEKFTDFLSGETNAFLVGGFAANPYLFKRLQVAFKARGVTLSRPDDTTSKAVADGAISHYLDNIVGARIAKYTYGTECCIHFLPFLPDHMKRRNKICFNMQGDVLLPSAFASILRKGTRVAKTEEFSVDMTHEKNMDAKTVTATILRYKGKKESPYWVDEERGMFPEVCQVEADISSLPKIAMRGAFNELFFEQELRVVLLFGLTELKAQICWDQDGEEKRSPARIVYGD